MLNADYQPIMVCSIQRAFLLVFLKKAELLSEVDSANLRTVSRAYPMPSVIRLQAYINIPYRGVVLTRQNVFKRDGFECQYCGATKDLTLDLVVPRSRGGRSTWTNLTTACRRCNSRKGDFAPEDVGLKLRSKPIKPSYVMFLKSFGHGSYEDWRPWLEQKAMV